MDNFRGLLGIKRMDRVPNARIRELCGVMKEVDERIDEGVLRWFSQVDRMEKERIAKRIYVGECASSRFVGRPRKRWNDTMKNCLRKRGLDVRQARRIVQDRCEWWEFARAINSTVVGCYITMKSLKGGSLSVAEATT